MGAIEREYDRFGPWAVEISDDDPLPALFAPWMTRQDTPLLCVKVPRHIERRDARPGMDLYDYVVALYEDDLVVLRRDGRDVRSESCRYREVRWVRSNHCLLRGSIQLGLPRGRVIDLAYNTVSETLMQRIVDLVRERYGRDPVPVDADLDVDVPAGTLSFYFDRLLGSLRRRGAGLHLLAAQGTTPVRPATTGRFRRFLFRVADKRLLETVHLSDGRELTVIGRGQRYAYRWEATDYAVEAAYLPIAGISGVDWLEDPKNEATDLALRTGDDHEDRFSFVAGHGDIDPYGAYLATVAATRGSWRLDPVCRSTGGAESGDGPTGELDVVGLREATDSDGADHGASDDDRDATPPAHVPRVTEVRQGEVLRP
jgi:hypothetical protein